MRGLFIYLKMAATFSTATSKNLSQRLHISGNKHFSSVCASLLQTATNWKPSKAVTDQPSPSPRRISSLLVVPICFMYRKDTCSARTMPNGIHLQPIYCKGHCPVGREWRNNVPPDSSHRLPVLLRKYDYTSTLTSDTSFFFKSNYKTVLLMPAG